LAEFDVERGFIVGGDFSGAVNQGIFGGEGDIAEHGAIFVCTGYF
jgi:hypothetical protein